MLEIRCPYCGPRAEIEFTCGGQAHIVRPRDPSGTSDEEWRDYLFVRESPKGIHHEQWYHAHGCHKWFNVVRNTVTDVILQTYELSETPPDLSGEAK